MNIQNGIEGIEKVRNSLAPKLIEDIKLDTRLTSQSRGFGFHELNPAKYDEQLNAISSITKDSSPIKKAIEGYQASLQALEELRKENIKNARFPEGHVEISTGDADKLADTIIKWFKESPGWGNKAENPYNILTVAITSDWRVMKRSILSDTIQYGLPIKLALQKNGDDDKGLARVYNMTILTQVEKGIKRSPPWANVAV